MVYGLWNKLVTSYFRSQDYSDEDLMTGTIYTDSAKTSVKNLTGYTLRIFIYDSVTKQTTINDSATIVTAANGTWSYAFTMTHPVPIEGIYETEIELTKTGVVVSTHPEEIMTRWSPRNG